MSECLTGKIWFFQHTKIRLNPKDNPFIWKIERVMWIFVRLVEAKISVFPTFLISKSQSVFEIWTQFFACELHFYRGSPSKYQLGVLHHSFIDFVGGGAQRPPRDNQPLPDPGFEGVKSNIRWQGGWLVGLNALECTTLHQKSYL